MRRDGEGNIHATAVGRSVVGQAPTVSDTLHHLDGYVGNPAGGEERHVRRMREQSSPQLRMRDPQCASILLITRIDSRIISSLSHEGAYALPLQPPAFSSAAADNLLLALVSR